MVEYIEYLNMPTRAAIILVALWIFLQLVGELLEVKGKIVPEFMKIRKYFKRKKAERAAMAATLAEAQKALSEAQKTMAEVKTQLQEINLHYSADNIKMRNNWMQDVDSKQAKDHAWIEKLAQTLGQINSALLEIRIEDMRSEIIGFAQYVIDPKAPVTREQFNRILKKDGEYEAILHENGKTNGETTIAMSIIRESYEEHLRTHSFVEDVRGYGIS